MSEPEQLDLLDWLAAQSPSPLLVAPAPKPAAAQTIASGPFLLTRVDPSCNMRRFYGLALATSLWGEAGVVRQWGRIGSHGQCRTDWHASPKAARAKLERVAASKRRRGYC